MTAQETFVEKLAQRLGGTAGAATVFGAPVERGDVTVIPVARAVYGFGGGSGSSQGDQGSGGGGGVRVAPVGYIEMRPGAVRYTPIRDWAVLIPAIASAGALTLVAVRGLAKLLRHRQSAGSLR
jgi:uncharacterized spore protein YtfJ